MKMSKNMDLSKELIGAGAAQSVWYWTTGVRSPTETDDFSSSPCVQTGSRAHPASCIVGNADPFPGGKARPGRDADQSLTPHLVPRLRMSRSETSSPPRRTMACSRTHFPPKESICFTVYKNGKESAFFVVLYRTYPIGLGVHLFQTEIYYCRYWYCKQLGVLMTSQL
jgi:hypothetical protein